MRAEIKSDLGQLIGLVDFDSKDFKTGSRGYQGTGKISIDGKKYQANFLLVEIGSKKKK